MRLGSGDHIFKTRQRPLFTHSYTQTQRKNNNNKFSSHLQILHATMACTGNSTHIQKEEKKNLLKVTNRAKGVRQQIDTQAQKQAQKSR